MRGIRAAGGHMSGGTDRQNVEERKGGEMRWGSVAGGGGGRREGKMRAFLTQPRSDGVNKAAASDCRL